ncbi:hypothetical protein [Streptomyces sp. NPDC093269]|uniref:hypothetical protein n=1 Tax=Streptomyces sp. NPDC093269 TaxID=3366038 RepID=UPI00381E0DFC
MNTLSNSPEVSGLVPVRPAGCTTALYRFYGTDDTLLYVGICDEPMARWSQHASNKPWWSSVHRFRLVWFPTRREAEKAEGQAIVSEKPLHNRAMNGIPNGDRFPVVHLYKFTRELYGDRPFSTRDLVEELGIPKGSAVNKIRELLAQGMFQVVGKKMGRSGRSVFHYRAMPAEGEATR